MRLKTDFAYWMARNSERHGGTGMPFAPFGADAVGVVEPIWYAECVDAGLLQRGQMISPTAEQVLQWGLDGVMPNVPAAFGPVCLP